MMKLTVFKLASLAALISLAAASPVAELAAKAAGQSCGQDDTIAAGKYTLSLNQWAKAGAKSVCARLVSQSQGGANIGWTTTWNWPSGKGTSGKGTSGKGIKSYTSVGVKTGLNKQISDIASIPSSWTWSQQSTSKGASSVVSSVGYNISTSATEDGPRETAVLIWLASYKAVPISSTGGTGKPVPAKKGISLAGHTWNLYSGMNGDNKVFTFVPSTGTIPKFNANLKLFFTYLVSNEEFSAEEYLIGLEAGTEATSGSATFKTTSYKTVITGGQTHNGGGQNGN